MIIIILLVAIIAFFYLMGINLLFSIPETAYYYIFSSIVQSEAAIFGILFIILTFSLQYVSNKYQINTLKIIENSKEIKSFTGIVVFSMITNLIALSLIKANWTIFSIVASFGIGSAFYFILSLYNTLKYTIKLSSLPNVTNALISSIPKSMEEFYKWLGRLKDIVGPVLESSDSIESKLIYLTQILPTVRDTVFKMLEYVPHSKKIEYSVKTFLAIIEPAVEIQQYVIIKAVVPETLKYLGEISPEASASFFKQIILSCKQNNFEECLKFILYNPLINYLKEERVNYEDNIGYKVLHSIYEIIANSFQKFESDPAYGIDTKFLKIILDFLPESLKSDIPSQQKEAIFVLSMKVSMILVEFFENPEIYDKFVNYKHYIDLLLTYTKDYEKSLYKFVAENQDIPCSEKLLELLEKEIPSLLKDTAISRLSRPRENLRTLVDKLYKNCNYSQTA